MSEQQISHQEKPYLRWQDLREFAEPEDLDEKTELEKTAKSYGVTPLQLAKVHYAVWMGTDDRQGERLDRDPLWRDELAEVAREIGEQKVIQIIKDYTDVEFPQDATNLKSALDYLPKLLKEGHKRAVEAIVGVLRQIPEIEVKNLKKPDA